MKHNTKIDIVYLYVNGQDSAHKQKKMFWAEKLNMPYSKDDENRDIDNEELKYSIRSVIKNAPWINNIFIVTDNQVPPWLDLTKTKKIKIVDHRDFIPEKYLPTFNSGVIESFIVDIPNLSEHFLYANDDCFINRPVKHDFFFDKDGLPIVRLKEKKWSLRGLRKSQYDRNIFHTINLINKKYGKLYNYTSHHNIDAYTKTAYKECISDFPEEFEVLRNQKFRGKSIQRIIFSLFLGAKKNARVEIIPSNPGENMHKDSLYINISDINTMQKKILERSPNLLCINDTPQTKIKHRENLKKFLGMLYPQKQKWEKDIDENEKCTSTKKCKILKNFIQNIFSIKNDMNNQKVITIMGIKLKYKIKGESNA